MAGLLAALWLLGLYTAAPVLRSSPHYGFVDRLRDSLALGVAIPLALATLHLLYPAACWLVLVSLAVAGARRNARDRRVRIASATGRTAPPLLLVAALALVAWPPLIRPLLDGDSLSYHLPNAASWVQSHSLWTTATRYWWYPPASESFASALYAVAGPYVVGWSGLAALALLGFRIEAWSRERYRAPAWLADALAAATVTSLPLALQSGTLQNDVWLAALFLETLWTLRRHRTAALAPVVLTALTKPYGWILAAIALAARRAPPLLWIAAIAAIACWAARCAILVPGAIVPAGSTWIAHPWATSIAAHGVAAFALFARVALAASPFALFAALAAVFGVLYERSDRALAWAALLAAAFFFTMPFVYDNGTPQLATGASLRQAAPAIAAGALLLLRPALRAPYVSYALFVLSSIFGAWSVLAIYWNDAPTRSALAAALVAVAVVTLARRLHAPAVQAALFAIAVIVAASLATRQTPAFYADALRADAPPSGVYAWIQRTKPPGIGGWGLRIGTVNVLSPGTRTIDLTDADPCADARANGVALVAVAERDRPAPVDAARLRAALRCGTIRYRDGSAVVVSP